MKKKGKFIVIDGTDGSGKATQVALLVARLKKEKHKIKTIDFPRYYDNFFGKLIGECLAGQYGDFLAVDPHIASIAYAADRWESSATVRKWIEDGYTVIADRYVSSSQIHQAGKITDAKKRKEFLQWLNQMEYGTFKIPKPDMIIFLEVPIVITQKLLSAKSLTQKKRYLEGKGDLAENDPKHLEAARKSAQKMVADTNNWHKVECAPKGELLSREEINNAIYTTVKKILKK
jgi:dTMP kinase